MEREEIVEKLTLLGLDREDADLYARLLQVGPAKVSALTPYVETSRSSLYRRLDELCERGLATKSVGQPTVYEARAPSAVFKRRSKTLEREQARIDALEEQLSEPLERLSTSKTQETQPHWQRLEGTQRIYDVVEQLLDEAEESIWAASNHPACFRTDVPVIERAWSAVGQRAEEGISTRVLLDFDHGSKRTLDPVLPLQAIEFRDLQMDGTIHVLIVDQEDVVVWARVGALTPRSGPESVALWTTAPNLVAGQVELFRRLWESSSPPDADEDPPTPTVPGEIEPSG